MRMGLSGENEVITSRRTQLLPFVTFVWENCEWNNRFAQPNTIQTLGLIASQPQGHNPKTNLCINIPADQPMGALSRANGRQKDCRSAARNPRWLNLAACVWETFITASVFWMILSTDAFGRAIIDTVFALSLWQKSSHTHSCRCWRLHTSTLTPRAPGTNPRNRHVRCSCRPDRSDKPNLSSLRPTISFAVMYGFSDAHSLLATRKMHLNYSSGITARNLEFRRHWQKMQKLSWNIFQSPFIYWGGKPNATINLCWFSTSSLIEPGNLWFHISSHICLFFFLKSCVCHWNSE